MVDVFTKLLKVGMQPNTFYVLHCIKHKMVPGKVVNAKLERQRLIDEEWLTEDFKLTDKSLIFVEEIDSYFRKSKKKTSKDLMGDDFLTMIKEFNEIVPKKKLPSGKYARVNVKTLETTFRWFFKEYDYDWETIIKATEKYVEEYSLQNYSFMRTAQYFVRKQNIDKSFDSDLATYCDMVLSGDDENDFYRENVV